MRLRRWVAIGLVGVLLAGQPAGGAGERPAGGPTGVALGPGLKQALAAALADGAQSLLVSVLAQPERFAAVQQAVQAAGGRLAERAPAAGYLSAWVAPSRVPALAAIAGMEALDAVQATRLADTSLQPDRIAARPERGLQPVREAVGAGQVGLNGSGVTLAVVDTGADPGHPDLGADAAGGSLPPGMVDWADFTGEGDVATPFAAGAPGGLLNTPGGVFRVPEGLSRSGIYHWGTLREDQLAPLSRLGGDLNRNGRSGERFGVLVADSRYAGVYDTVLLDVNGDSDFRGDPVLHRLDVTALGSGEPGRRLNLVLTQVQPDGDGVNFGFDGHGHGTHVTAIAAGRPGAGAGQGVAPGARLMVLKAVDSGGEGRWDRVARALAYAAEHGADVVVVSLGGQFNRSGELTPESQLLSRLSRAYNTLFVLAAGNNGPGLSSAGSLGDGREVLTAGAFMTPSLWQDYLGYPVTAERLREFSAIGPARDGSLSPQVVAPGSAFAAVPEWLAARGRLLAEGTSVAAPAAAGVAALVWEHARAQGEEPSYRSVKQALQQGARMLAGYQVVEQGFGAVYAPGAVQRWVPEAPGAAHGAIRAKPLFAGQPAGGVLMRSTPPGRLRWQLAASGQPASLRLRSTAAWFRPDRERLNLPAQGERQMTVDYSPLPEPGLYSGLLIGEPDGGAAGGGAAAEPLILAMTAVRPYELEAAQGYRVAVSGFAGAGDYRRYFFRIPQGVQSFTLRASVPRTPEGELAGALLPYIASPSGRTAAVAGYVGRTPRGQVQDVVRYTITAPEPGVWEVIAYVPPELALQDRQTGFFNLEVSLSGVLIDAGARRLVAPEAGGRLSETVQVANLGRPFIGRLIGAGFGANPSQKIDEVVRLTEGEAVIRKLPAVTAGTLWLQVNVTNPNPRVGNLDLTLYRFDDQVNDWREVGGARYPRGFNQVIEMPAPLPGNYLLLLNIFNTGGKPVEYQLHAETVRDTGDIAAEDRPLERARGEAWQVPVQYRLPPAAGRYFGRLAVVDEEDQRLLATVPVTLDQGLPDLEVLRLQPFPQPPGGSPAARRWTTLEVRRAATGALVPDVPVQVNGRFYETAGGRLSIPVEPGPLHVVIDAPGYAYYRRVLP